MPFRLDSGARLWHSYETQKYHIFGGSMNTTTATRCKRVLTTLLLSAAMTLGVTAPSQAIDFKAKGQWYFGFGLGDANLVSKDGGKRTADDLFRATQRIRLLLEARASENLSGTVHFEIGDQTWGMAGQGGALGADGNNVVEVKQAYLDWTVPSTSLSFRMGIVGLALPYAAGDSSVLDADTASLVANYKFNENVGLTAFWARPANDNFTTSGANRYRGGRNDGYLDNIDLFTLALPLRYDGLEVTPWVMYGIFGKNVHEGYSSYGDARRYGGDVNTWRTADADLLQTFFNARPFTKDSRLNRSPRAYSNMFWVGLPVKVRALEPWNIEFDFNYGSVQGIGTYDVKKRGPRETLRADTQRSGWLAKALVEYRFDWGVPGIFGWYASGDDGNMKNGSERMPSVAPMGRFTSFNGDGNLAWGLQRGAGQVNNAWYNRMISYAGTWGVGLQVRDVSFVEDLSHTIRAAYWGGTNSPSMTKYFTRKSDWNQGYYADGTYLTTNDGLLEFNLVNRYKIYENLEMNLELGYIVNMIDKSTWDRSWMEGGMQRKDAWKSQLTFAYRF